MNVSERDGGLFLYFYKTERERQKNRRLPETQQPPDESRLQQLAGWQQTEEVKGISFGCNFIQTSDRNIN